MPGETTMKITHYIPITALALAVLAGGTDVLAQEAGEASDSAAAPGARNDMPMMGHGDMRRDSGMPDMIRMMRMMRSCMDMMDSMDMDSMPTGMGMKDAMGEGPETALRHSKVLGLSERQLEQLAEARGEWREARKAAMDRMREAHAAMREAAGDARDRTRELLTAEQRDRLSELASAGMEGCPMHGNGSGAEPGAESEEAPPGGGDS